MDMEHKNIQLLDLSDELLLNIFRHCSPGDLKAFSLRNKWMLIWLENEIKKFDDVSTPVSSVQDSTCPGPHFTLSAALMVQLQIVCPALTSMSVEYCNINCYNGAISQFPPTLRHLSLRGVRCYNMRRRFLNRISNYLPYLESLDGSECEFINCLDWPTLSELRNLRRLILQNCTNLNGTMYLGRNKINFGKLEVLDLRESQVSIAEVRELGLMPKLQKLYTSSPPVPPQICTHGHFKDDTLPSFQELDGWELEEPEYLKKYSISINLDDIERNPWIPSPYLTEDQYYEAFDNYWRTIQALCFKQNKINNDGGEDRNNVNENIINNNDNKIDQNENEIVRND